MKLIHSRDTTFDVGHLATHTDALLEDQGLIDPIVYPRNWKGKALG